MRNPDEAFERLFGMMPTDELKKGLMRVQRALGLRTCDAVWSIFVALGYYQQLYEAIPDEIRRTSQRTLEDYQEAARADMEGVRAAAVADLHASVSNILPTVVGEVVRANRMKWCAIALIATFVLVASLVGGIWITRSVAYDEGFEAAGDVPRTLVAWARSEHGLHARALDRMNLLGPLRPEQILWLTGPEGWRFHNLGERGVLRGIGDEEVEWLASRNGQRALELDRQGLLDGATLDDMNWIRGERGRIAREMYDAGLLDFEALAKLRWLEESVADAIYRTGRDEEMLRTLRAVEQCLVSGGATVCE